LEIMSRLLRIGCVAALTALPSAGALVGAHRDELDHLGFTKWRSASQIRPN